MFNTFNSIIYSYTYYIFLKNKVFYLYGVLKNKNMHFYFFCNILQFSVIIYFLNCKQLTKLFLKIDRF